MADPVAASQADIIVRVYDNWVKYVQRDMANASPNGDCIFDGVAFVRGPRPAADWHVILNSIDWHLRSVRFRGRPNRTIFALGEPASPIHRPWHLGQGTGTIVLTCDHEEAHYAGLERRFERVPMLVRSWSVDRSYQSLKSSTIPPEEKTKQLSWITSSLNLLEGHAARMRFLQELQGQVSFDLYGRGFREIHDKWHALAPYRYSLAYENYRAPLVMSEKLMDCFVAETMPIYYGSPAVTDYFPSESMVIIDPEDPDVFRIIADVAASDRWLKNRDAILEAKRITLDEMNAFKRLAQFIRHEHATTEPDPQQWMRVNQVQLKYT
ncbi:MAG: glycosyltransferase family 10 [Erythrobacter sp.]|uniref:glycosyltransferase family 10 domain-containing protein n=1 Tax=Erythrobacter sp. TaxID=1042 RepID=UPI0032EB1AB1